MSTSWNADTQELKSFPSRTYTSETWTGQPRRGLSASSSEDCPSAGHRLGRLPLSPSRGFPSGALTSVSEIFPVDQWVSASSS